MATASELRSILRCRADDLEARAKIIREAANRSATSDPQAYADRPELYDRLIWNNQRFDVLQFLYRAASREPNASEAYGVMRHFAEAGDPLACAIMESEYYMKFEPSIAAKFLLRTMREEEYFRYLDGGLPIMTRGPEQYFLPKQDLPSR